MLANLKKELPSIRPGVPLSKYSTFGIGGFAEYFFIAKEKDDLLAALAAAKRHRLPVFVFGGGSNLLFADQGVKGLVIRMESASHYALKGTKLEANAGVPMATLVSLSVKHSLAGLEWAGGLPGTFGGAIRGNAGCFGAEIKDSIVQVQALDKKNTLRKLSNKECQFRYRSSIFKKKEWLVLSATVKLKPGNKKELQAIATSHINFRKERHPLEYPNAGSIFKNVDLKQFSEKWQQELQPVVKKDPFPVVPTAYLISQLGLKGTQVGQAQISTKHPNFIVNLGGARASDVLALIEIAKKSVKKTYGVDLEVEVQYVN